MKRVISTISIILHCCFCMLCEDFYRDYLTGFSDISNFNDKSGHLIIKDNNDTAIETKGFYVKDMDFSYTIRVKPTQSKEDRFILSRNKKRYGIVWNYRDSNNYSALSLTHNNMDYDDITNNNHIEAEIYTLVSGKKEILYREKITYNINLNDGYNSIGLQYKNDRLEIKVGDHKLKTIAHFEPHRIDTLCNIGYFSAKGSDITIKRIHFKSTLYKTMLFETDYNKEILDSIFRNTTDTNIGYWVYLDRKMDESRMKLGGKYRVAIVPDDNGYKILLIDGIEKQPSLWKPFMIKGFLKETAFIGNYDLEWIDADKNIISDESYASFSDNILTIHLPTFNSEVRFYKQQ